MRGNFGVALIGVETVGKIDVRQYINNMHGRTQEEHGYFSDKVTHICYLAICEAVVSGRVLGEEAALDDFVLEGWEGFVGVEFGEGQRFVGVDGLD